LFFNKANTLEFLSDKTIHSKVLPLIRFNTDFYRKNKFEILKKIKDYFKSDNLIIRSSAVNEDTIFSSNAGHFESVLNVDKKDSVRLSKSIEKVIKSFESEKHNEVLVQPMLEEMTSCGVAFTADIDTLAPYYIINYDTRGNPNSVTSGGRGDFKTHIYLKNSDHFNCDPSIKNLIRAFKELEEIFKNNFLDVEFGVNSKSEIFIFQVRPIVTFNKENNYDLNLKEVLYKVERKIEKLRKPHPNLLGDKAIFGVMPDWNPAEIIGLKPRRLSLSLYKELITDGVWAYQRDNYGYRNLRSHPLLISFLGIPYIDVRVDFNSFIPKKLNDLTANKLCKFYLNKLSKFPSFHDKIEFKIVHSCYYFGLNENLEELLENGFSKEEVNQIIESLTEITNKIIDPSSGLFYSDLKKIDFLKDKKDKILNSDLSKIDKIYWLTEYCKRYGTLPFAGIARAAFISTQILNSFRDLGILSSDDYENFLKSLGTITSQMEQDLYNLSIGRISKKKFLSIYGHLRPGTYDILSPRYDQQFDNYFNTIKIKKRVSEPFIFLKSHTNKIDELISKSGLRITSEGLIKFVKDSIKAREYSKFIFTTCLSDVLKLIEELGTDVGKTKEEMSHVDIKTILSLYNDLNDSFLNEIFDDDILKFKRLFKYTNAIKLPPLILKPYDIYGFESLVEQPNFISLNKIRSSVVLETEILNKDLENKIVMIKSADPGFDFLFSKKIGGLVTQFGGANSHMAIRCSELGIPAVIGAGESNFKLWSNAEILDIDSINQVVKVIL